MKKNALLILILFGFLYSHGQEKNWMIMVDCGYYANARCMDLDPQGNVYLGGRFQGEVEFHSATDTGKVYNDFTSQHWMKSFVVKYSAEGDLQYVLTLKTAGSNQGGCEPFALKCLKNGDFAIQLYASQSFMLKTPFKEQRINANGGTILRFKSNGEFLWSCQLRDIEYRPIIEDDEGNLYTIGKKSYRKSNMLIKVNEEGVLEKEIDLADERIGFMKRVGNDIWFTTMKTIKQGEYTHAHTTDKTFYTYNLSTEALSEKFTMHLSYSTEASFDVALVQNELQIMAWLSSRQKSITYREEEFNMETQQLLLRLDENGAIKRTAYTPNLFHYNRTLLLDDEGFLYAYAPGSDTLKWHDQTAINPREHSNQFTQEMYLVKLDHEFKPKWIVNGGGTASNYHYSKIVKQKDQITVASDLLDYGTIMGEFTGLKWRSGLYILQIKDENE